MTDKQTRYRYTVSFHWRTAGRTYAPPATVFTDPREAMDLWRDVRDRPTAHGIPSSAEAAMLSEMIVQRGQPRNDGTVGWSTVIVDDPRCPAIVLWDRLESDTSAAA